MFNRRSLLFSVALVSVPAAAAFAQPWWDERREQAEWEHERERERRLAIERHERWDKERAHREWERRRRIEAQREWEREHGPRR